MDGVEDLALADLLAAAADAAEARVLRGEARLFGLGQRGEVDALADPRVELGVGSTIASPSSRRIATTRSAIAGAAVSPGDWMPAQLMKPFCLTTGR